MKLSSIWLSLILFVGCQSSMLKTSENSLREKSLLYFSTFSNQDIKNLEKMFAKDVYLRDWEKTFRGKSEVVKANQGIFDSVKTIKVNPLNIIVSGNEVAAEIEVVINGGETKLLVLDFLTFNKDGLITSVRAYKGN